MRGGIVVAVLTSASACGRLGFDPLDDGVIGEVDPDFGIDGFTVGGIDEGLDELAYALLPAPGGRGWWTVGLQLQGGGLAAFMIGRWNPDGTIDGAFGANGYVLHAPGAGRAYGYGATIDAAGRPVLVGDGRFGVQDDFAAMRVDASGTLDPAFSGNGWVNIDAGLMMPDTAKDIAPLPGGAVVMCGSASYNQADPALALIALDVTGALDAGFGLGGISRHQLSGDIDVCFAVDTSDAGIFVTGRRNGTGLLAVRFTAAGALDPAFGGPRGVELDDMAGEDVLAMPDGGALVCGRTGSDGFVVRLTPDGTLDPRFGSGGLVTIDHAGFEAVNALALDPRGRILVGGRTETSGRRDGMVVRLLPDGAIDPEFGVEGFVTYDLMNTADELTDLLIDSAGLVLAGHVDVGGFQKPYVGRIR